MSQATDARYQPQALEQKWQTAWEQAEVFTARRDPAKPKYYVLEMFPYPSGRIHMGHVRNYTMGDVVARYKAAQGFSGAAPDGVGRLRYACGKRRHGAGRPPQGLDLWQY